MGSESKPKTLTALAIAMSPAAFYLIGYLAAGDYTCGPNPFDPTVAVNRDYSYGWQVLLFTPAGHLESKVRSIRVILSSPYRGNTIEPVNDDSDFWQ